MTQKDTIAEMAAKNGFWLYLEHLLVPPLAAEYRRAHDELRKEGWLITVKQNYQERSKNIYHYIPPKTGIDSKAPVSPVKESDPKQSTTVQTHGKIRGFYKLTDRYKADLVIECRRIQGTYPESHIQYKRISEQVERLKCKC